KAARGSIRPVFQNGLMGGLIHPGIAVQVEIIIGPEIDVFLTADHRGVARDPVMLEKVGAFEIDLSREILLQGNRLILGEFLDPVIGFGYCSRLRSIRRCLAACEAWMLLENAAQRLFLRLT